MARLNTAPSEGGDLASEVFEIDAQQCSVSVVSEPLLSRYERGYGRKKRGRARPEPPALDGDGL